MNKYNIKQEKSYMHLSIYERELICWLKASNLNNSKIAEIVGRHRTTIWREFKKNNPPANKVLYFPHEAHNKALKRKRDTHKRGRLKNDSIREYVKTKLKEKWSPEQIAGRITIDFPDYKTNHESIYLYIYEENRKFIKYLPKQHKKRKKRCSNKKKRREIIPNRTFIEERPEKINDEYGHWEADTVVSRKSKVALQVLEERKTKIVRITKLERKTAKEMRKALNRRLCKIPHNMRKSITYDNGTENSEHEIVNKTIGTISYFCRPYSSWQKGMVENSIGLVRRYLPKKTNFALIEKKTISTIESELNNRPRKCLGFKTPNEVFLSICCT